MILGFGVIQNNIFLVTEDFQLSIYQVMAINMISNSGRYIIVFNGEIYNHNEIRNNYFKFHTWKSTSDTETVLAAFEIKLKILII